MSHIIIIGAGITGLQTAVSLLTKPSTSDCKITIIASHLPGDHSIEYTSPWAGADWRPSTGLPDDDARIRHWDKASYNHWMDLLEDKYTSETMAKKEKGLGLARRALRYFWGEGGAETVGHDGRGLWWEKCPEEDKLSLEYRSRVCFLTSRATWTYCFRKPKKHGAKVARSSVECSNGLHGLVEDARLIAAASWHESSSTSFDDNFLGLINCAGLAARKFVSPEESSKLCSIRGQTVLVKGEAALGTSYAHVPNTDGQESLYVIPRPGSGTTILGGCKQAGSWNGTVDDGLSIRIMDKIKREGLAEELRTGKGGEFEVVSAQVGLRPGRHGGPRVEIDSTESPNGTWVIHAYGHGGAGYQNSVGSAARVVELVEGLLEGNGDHKV